MIYYHPYPYTGPGSIAVNTARLTYGCRDIGNSTTYAFFADGTVASSLGNRQKLLELRIPATVDPSHAAITRSNGHQTAPTYCGICERYRHSTWMLFEVRTEDILEGVPLPEGAKDRTALCALCFYSRSTPIAPVAIYTPYDAPKCVAMRLDNGMTVFAMDRHITSNASYKGKIVVIPALVPPGVDVGKFLGAEREIGLLQASDCVHIETDPNVVWSTGVPRVNFDVWAERAL